MYAHDVDQKRAQRASLQHLLVILVLNCQGRESTNLVVCSWTLALIDLQKTKNIINVEVLMFRKLSSVEGLFGFIYIPYFSYDILIGCLFLCSSITLLTYMCSFSLLVIFLY